jgi:hypothetical protein
MIKLVTNGKVKIDMRDEDNEIISSEEEVSFELMKKDDGAVDDFISSNGKVEMIARCKDQDITFVLDTSELLKCLKFLEN